jgi:two-component system LytT family response regulator
MMEMEKLKCVVFEDEDYNRKWLIEKLKTFEEIEIVGEAVSINEAFQVLLKTRPDVAFMDIKLIGGDVFALLTRLKTSEVPIPFIVITTGFPEYVMTALNEYRHYIVQYLVKPFVDEWETKLRKAVDALMAAKLGNNTSPQANKIVEQSKESADHIFINSNRNYTRIDFKNVAYLESAGGGSTFIVTDKETHTVDQTINKCLENLFPPHFVRVSKSNAVNLHRIQKINREDRTLEIQLADRTKSVGVGEVFYGEVMGRLG